MEIKVNFKRKLKLAPAIGDWTIIDHFLEDKELEEADIAQVKDPNFDSLPQENLTYLHYFHYRFFERLLNHFAKLSNVKIDFHSIEVTQLSAMAFKNYIDGEIMQGEIKLSTIGNAKLILGKTFSEVMVNRVLGGKGAASGRKKFTNLDFSVLTRVFKGSLAIFQDIWKNVVPIDQETIAIHKGPYVFDQQSSRRDAYIFFKARFSFSSDDQICNLILVYPNYVLRQLLNLKSKRHDPIKKSVTLFSQTMSKIFVPISVCIGETKLPMVDIQNLQVGDVVTLDSNISDPVSLKIEPDIKLYVQPGTKGKKTCVQLIDQRKALLALNEYTEPKIKKADSNVVDNILDDSVSVEDATIAEPRAETPVQTAMAPSSETQAPEVLPEMTEKSNDEMSEGTPELFSEEDAVMETPSETPEEADMEEEEDIEEAAPLEELVESTEESFEENDEDEDEGEDEDEEENEGEDNFSWDNL